MIAIEDPALSPSSLSNALKGTRWLVVDSAGCADEHEQQGQASAVTHHASAGSAAAAQAIVRELRAAGCQVRRVDVVGLQLARLSSFDAQLVLINERQDMRFLQERMASHAGLRWASTLRTPWPDLWHQTSTDREPRPDIEALARHALPLLEPDRTFHDLARGIGDVFEASSEPLGPIRTLRAVCMANNVFRVTFVNEGAQGHIELAGNLLLGAWFQRGTEPMLMGAEALAGTIEMEGAQVTVRRKVRPKAPWFVKPLDEALELALLAIRERRAGEYDDSPTMRIAPELISEAVGGEPCDPGAETSPAIDVTALFTRGLPPSSTSLPSIPPPSIDRRRWLGALVAVSVLVTILVATRSSSPTSAAVVPSRASQVQAQRPQAKRPQPGVAVVSSLLPARSTPPASGASAPAPRALPLVQARRGPPAAIPPERLAEPQSRNVYVVAARARAALLRRDFVNARAWAERATSLRPRRAQYRLLYGDVLAESGLHEQALAQYLEGLKLKPDSSTLEQRIARVKNAQSQY